MPYKDPKRALENRRRYYEANKDRIKKRVRAWYIANRERERARRLQWYLDNKERADAKTREYRKKNAADVTLYHRAWKYGLTKAQAKALLARGKCAICSDTKNLHIDHDHVTGKVRDVLCSGCNTGLGSFRDSIEKLSAAVEYLLKHGRAKAA